MNEIFHFFFLLQKFDEMTDYNNNSYYKTELFLIDTIVSAFNQIVRDYQSKIKMQASEFND